MKIKRTDFVQQTQNKKVSVQKLQQNNTLTKEQKDSLVQADLDRDGFVSNAREVNHLFARMNQFDGERDGQQLTLNAVTTRMHTAIQSASIKPSPHLAPTSNDPMASRVGFLKHFEGQSISTTRLHQQAGSMGSLLVQADLNRDGQIKGHAELNQLYAKANAYDSDRDGNTLRHNPQTNRIRKAIQSSTWGTGRSVHSRRSSNGVHRQPGHSNVRRTSSNQHTLKNQVIRTITRAGGTATAADVAVISNELRKMPIHILQTLQRSGTRIIAAREGVGDYFKDLQHTTPRGWPPGTTWMDVPGVYDPGTKEVVIATKTGAGGRRIVPTKASGAHGSVSLTIHEVAHAYDHAMGDINATDRAFHKARRADLQALRRESDYFTQPGAAGLEESYAESLAMYISNPQRMKTGFPNLHTYWSQRFK